MAAKARQQVGRGRVGELSQVHAAVITSRVRAARASRSLMASPRPSCGIRMTAMRRAPAASSARRCENRLAAASTRSPRGDRLSVGAGGRRRAEGQQGFAGLQRESASSRSPALRRVMRGEHAGRERALLPPAGASASACAEHALDVRARQPAGPQQRGSPRQDTIVEFNADRARSAVDDQVDPAAQIGQHMRRAGRRHVAGAVGRGRDHRPAECRKQRLRATGCAGTRTATVSSPAGARSATGQSGRFGSTSVSGPGQNAAASRSRVGVESARAARAASMIGDMRDQRIEGRPALGLVEPRDRLAVGARRRPGRRRSRSGRRQARRPPGSARAAAIAARDRPFRTARSRLAVIAVPQACGFSAAPGL